MTNLDQSNPAARPHQPERLPCGRWFDELLEQVAGSEPAADREHQANCPHCRATLAELVDVWAPVRTLSQQRPAPPDTLVISVMERVAAIASHGWHAVLTDNAGVTRIAAWVVAIVARRAASAVRGVGQVGGKISPPAAVIADVRAGFERAQPSAGQRARAAGVGVAGRRVVVAITVTAEPGQPLPALAEAIRTAVTRHVRALTGLDVIEVDVHVSDLDQPDVVPQVAT